MLPYHHDPETDAAVRSETHNLLTRMVAPFKRVWVWLGEKMPEPNENGIYVPPMGYGGIGGYYPAIHSEDCGCGDTMLSKRDRWDMPIARENWDVALELQDVVTPLLKNDIKAVFQFFERLGPLVSVVALPTGTIEARYESGEVVTYTAPVEKEVPREGL